MRVSIRIKILTWEAGICLSFPDIFSAFLIWEASLIVVVESSS
jgi:hypothetical protein